MSLVQHAHLPRSYVRKIRVRRFLAAIYHDNVPFLASALSFDALLAAIPLVLLFFAVLGTDDLRIVLDLVMPVLSSEGAPLATAERILTAVVESRRELSMYAVPMFLLFSTRLFSSTRIALDQIRAVRTKRRFIHDLAYDLFLVVATTTLLVANSYVSIPVLGFAPLDRLTARLLGIAFGTVLFFVVYVMAPTHNLEWRTALLVALIVSILFEVSKLLFGVYLVRFATVNRVISHANAIALMLFVVWVYLLALLFLIGGEIAKAVEDHRHGIAGEPVD